MRSSQREGVSIAADAGGSPEDLAARLSEQMPPDGLAGVIVFFSPTYCAEAFAAEMARRYAGIPVYGCTTSGELAPQGLSEGSAVALGLSAEHFSIAAQPILDLSSFQVERGRALTNALRSDLSRCSAGSNRNSVFGILLVDGLCRREEALISAIYSSLDDIPVIGGSAGDDLRFERTWIVCDGKAYSDAAVLLLIKTDLPFRPFKCDNFEPTAMKMVVTEADIEHRIVKELNAEPAALEYCRTVGVPDSSLNAFCFASHPVIVRVGGEYYARSIQRVNTDGSLSFFCAIDEGLVLTIARRRDMLESMRAAFLAIEKDMGEVAMYLGFDCVLRRLDAEQHQVSRDLSELYREHRVVGFNTYGEQFSSMHLNQTFTGIAIGRPEPS